MLPLMAERGTYYRLYTGGLEIDYKKKKLSVSSGFFWLMDKLLRNFP